MYFKVIVRDGPLGKTQYYIIRVEFQVNGSPHIQSFIWILNAPKLTKFNVDKYTKWVDSIVKLDLPDSVNESILSELVKTYQIHHYLTTFRNYRNEKCRFYFEQLENSVPADIKRAKMQYRKTILKKVKNYTNLSKTYRTVQILFAVSR